MCESKCGMGGAEEHPKAGLCQAAALLPYLQTINQSLTMLRQSVTYLANVIQQQGVKVMANLIDIQNLVASETTVEQGVETLLSNLSQELQASANDPAKINAIALALNNNISGLTAALTANTPAATTPTAQPDTSTTAQPSSGS